MINPTQGSEIQDSKSVLIDRNIVILPVITGKACAVFDFPCRPEDS